ncbi:sugar transferase [Glaciihabitans sp. INWT7]|nr:sugar transferase [Glaciihabitans sp. INWT7]QNE48052.1 sugar transferase [Glaciihabitans sp. INWT7]
MLPRSLSGVAWARAYRTRLRVTDTIVILASVSLGYVMRLLFEPDLFAENGSLLRFGLGSVAVVALWAISLDAFRSRDLKVVGIGQDEYRRIVAACFTFFGTLAMVFVVGGIMSAQWFFVVAAPLGTIGLLLGRWSWRKWLIRQRAFGHFLSRVVVVGKRKDVIKVIRQIDRNSSANYSVVGAVIDKHDTEADDGVLRDIRVHRGLDKVADFAGSIECDGIVVAGQPTRRGDFIQDLAWELEGRSLELILATSLANVAGPRIHFRPVDGLPLIHVEIPQFDGGKHVTKRVMDIVLATIALVVLSPLLVVIGILVRLESDGPALFTQQRVGRNGVPFQIFKFRSMTADAPERLSELRDASEGNGVLFKIKNDPRVTKLGRVLRKYSLDELPQIWNVLIGDMSLVGPRPPLPVEVDGYEDRVRRRLYIKPGLTGMWQINGRSTLSWEDSVRLDLYYVENWSVVGDLMIMWRTVKVIIAPVGAY